MINKHFIHTLSVYNVLPLVTMGSSRLTARVMRHCLCMEAAMPNHKYTPNSYAEVGRGLLAASLDIFDSNPLPRVAPNQVKALR